MIVLSTNIDPLWPTAIFVALLLGFLHMLFLPGILLRQRLPRPVAYMAGVGVIFIGFTALYLISRQQLQPIVDLAVLIVAGAIPTLGLRLLAEFMARRDAMKLLEEKPE